MHPILTPMSMSMSMATNLMPPFDALGTMSRPDLDRVLGDLRAKTSSNFIIANRATVVNGSLLAALALLSGFVQSDQAFAMKFSDTTYIAEWKLSNGKYAVTQFISTSGRLSAVIKASREARQSDSFPQLQEDRAMQTFTFSHGVAMFLPIAAAYIADRASAITLNALGAEPFDTSKPSYIPNFIDALEGVTEMPKREILFALALDAAYRIEQNDTNSGFWVREPQGNNIPRLSLNRLPDSGLVILDGDPSIIGDTSSSVPTDNKFSTWREKFKSYTSKLSWTPYEEQWIPEIPDDFEVPQEVLRIANLFVRTQADRRPMVNFMWRGPTSYGKSTGVECLAALLHTPLLRFTCHSATETQDFLADFVPDTSSSTDVNGLPTAEDMVIDPVASYEKITGTHKTDATSDECLSAYASVAGKGSSSSPKFKFVESTYVRALTNGYIIEVQEASRIRNPGTLVGLNEFDRPGSIIPLINGEFKRRSPHALAIFTDNIGYASCRPLDPSVLRRMSLIIDSDELTKDQLYARVKYNIGDVSKQVLDTCYTLYNAVLEFCKVNDMMDSASLSATEFEMLVRCVTLCKHAKEVDLEAFASDCLVSKATSDPEIQKEIRAGKVKPIVDTIDVESLIA